MRERETWCIFCHGWHAGRETCERRPHHGRELIGWAVLVRIRDDMRGLWRSLEPTPPAC